MSDSMKKALLRMEDNYESAKKKAGALSVDLPLGSYTGTLRNAEIRERPDESLYIIAQWVVTEAPSDELIGKMHTDFQNINPDHLEYVIQWFNVLGKDAPERFRDYPAELEKISKEGIVAKFQLSESKGFRRLRIKEIICSDAPDAEETPNTSEPVPEPAAKGKKPKGEVDADDSADAEKHLTVLKALAVANSISGVTKKTTRDETVAIMNDFEWSVKADKLKTTDIEALEFFDIEVTVK